MATNAGLRPIADARDADMVLDETTEGIYERTWGLRSRVDPSVTFEEYQYWAVLEREDEMEQNRLYVEERGPRNFGSVIKGRFSKGIHHENKKKAQQEALQEASKTSGSDEKDVAIVDSPRERSPAVSPEEWKQAARALKTASWGTIFFLITTDILGWSSTP